MKFSNFSKMKNKFKKETGIKLDNLFSTLSKSTSTQNLIVWANSFKMQSKIISNLDLTISIKWSGLHLKEAIFNM